MKARSLCLLAGLFLAAAVPAQAALTFTQSAGGPQSSAGDLYPRGDGAIYSLLSDRVYKSTDGGSNWSLLGGAPPERASMLAFAGTDLYAAGVFGVLRSTDDGVTWNDFNGSADTALPFTTVYQLYSTGSFLFAVGQDDNFNPLVYRSAVGGASWSNVTPPGIGSNQVNSGAVTGSTLCLSVTNSGIRYTANGGDSWSSSSGVSGNIPFVAASPAAAGTVYASNSGGGMFRSTNSCGAFSGIGSALTGVTGGLVTRLGVDASAHVYVASADGNVRMSSNPASSAATYDLINGGSLPADTQVPVLGFAPVSGGIVAGSTGLGLNFSDGTSNWTRRGNGLKGGAISALMSGPGTSIALTAGGVLSTSDSGATYTEDNNGLVLRNTGAIVRKGNTWLVAAFQPSNGSGTAPPGLYRSTDAGATWTQLLAASGLPAGAGIGDLVSDGSSFYATVASADTFSLRGVYKSTDGATWTSASSGLPANPSIRNLAIRGTKLWVYLGGQGLFRSTDGAASWQNVTTGLSGDLFGKVFAASTVLIASAGGVVYRSTDDGDTWAATTGYAVSKFGIEILSMAEDAAGALYLGDEHAGLSVSKDAGVTWAPSSNGLATSNVCIERINSLLFKGGKIYAGQGEGGGVRVSSPIGAAAPGDSVACTTDKDIFPNNFSFTAQTNVKPSTLVKSNIITVAGLGNGVSVPISVSGGEFAKSATCGAGFTTTTGHVVNGDQVCVRHTSAATSETSVKTRLTIGDKSATFTSSTGLVFTGRTDEINTGFGSNGFASVASQTTASDVKILADGSFVSAAATSGFPADIAITKFNYDGSVDTSFGVGGVAKFDAGGSESVVAVIAQSSGKLVAVANTRIGTPSATNKIVLVRFNADGSIDSGFGTSGMVTFDLNPNQSGNGENASSAIALSDGSILIGGGVAITGTGTHFFVVKFSADGVQDTSFGTANATLGSTFADVQVGSSTVVGGALAVQSDGKVLMSGQADVGFNTIRGLVVRFTSAGVLDSGFGSSGKFASASAIALPALLVLGDGSIMAAGQTTSSPFSPVMTRLTSSGALDTSFGSSGVLTLTLSGNSSSGSLSSLLLLANGGIAFSGQAYQSDLGASALLFGILNSNGTLDTSFGNNHGYLVRRPVNGSNVLGGRMAQRADGGVLFGGLYGSSLGAFVFGGTSGPPPDTTPNAFTFATKTAVSRNVQVTSAAKAIKGINAPAPVTISGGTYSIGTTDCGNTYTSAAGMISNGQKICLRHTSSRSPATKTSTIVTIGGVSGTFSSVTVDDVPAAFKFTDAAGVTPSSVVVSDTVTVSGIDAPAAVSVKNGEYSIGISDCGNTFTSADGTISNGQMICVRHTAAAGNNKAINTVLIIGGVQDTFSSVTAKGTGTADVMPNFFHFPDVNNAAPSTLTASQALTIAGIANGSTAVVKVTGGEYSIDGGAFTSADGTIGSGQTIAVRLTSSANASTPVSATLNISGLTDAFTVTTGK